MNTSLKNLPKAVVGIMILNALAYLLVEFLGSTEDVMLMYRMGALFAPSVLEDGEYYRLLTAAFLHFGTAHFMNNMLMLYVLGERLERAVGSLRFLVIYLISALGANVCTVIWYSYNQEYTISAGASGGIMGIVGAVFARILRKKGRDIGMDRRQILTIIVLSLYSGFVSSQTNNAAHISGLIFGFLAGVFC